MIHGYATVRVSTDELPERERLGVVREVFGRTVLRIDLQPESDSPFWADFAAHMLPGLGIVSATSSPLRAGRTRDLLVDGNDGLILQVSTSPGIVSQRGHEILVQPGDGVVMTHADVGEIFFPQQSTTLGLFVPRAAFASLLRDFDSVLLHPVPKQTEALRLLIRFLSMIQDEAALTSPSLQGLSVAYTYDLLALALGATRDAAETARVRGLRAARLLAIKDDVLANLHQPELTLDAIAARQRVTPRYVQKLFEAEGTTFSQFVRDQRLAQAHRMLVNPAYAGVAVKTIAYDLGFGDLSNFNHAFRRRYGMSPSDVRAAALARTGRDRS
jgi:AraC-like DNA-binding protein